MSGYFEQWANQIRWSESSEDRAEMGELTKLVQSTLKGQIHWAGSQSKSTAIEGSDLDVCIVTNDPVTKGQRRELAKQIAINLQRPTEIKSHVIRVGPRAHSKAKLDIAFANAEFGNRPLPDKTEFKDPRRQHATRALKYWLRSGGMPYVGGWAIEGLVVGLDDAKGTGCDLFLKILEWLARPCPPNDIESILKPRALPKWNSDWSKKLPGQIQAIANQAKNRLSALKTRSTPLSSAADVEEWLNPKRGQ